MQEKIKFDYSALEGKIKQYYDTQDNFAKALLMSRTSLNQKLNNVLDFTASNIYRICKLLSIDENLIPLYFFTLKVQKTELENKNQ